MKWPMSKRSTRILIASVSIALLLFIWCLIPPSFEFDFASRTADRDDVFALAALAKDLQQIQDWDPRFLKPRAISDLAAWITYPSNLNATSARELRRDNAKEMAIVNGQLLLLESSGQGEFVSLRELTKAELETELKNRLTKCRDDRRDASFTKIALLASNRRLLERCDCSSFPVYSNPVRAIVSTITGWRLEDRKRWVEQYIKAVEKQVVPVVRQYAAIDRRDVVTLPTDGPGRLALYKRQNGSLPETIYRGRETTSDFDLRWIPPPQLATNTIEEPSPAVRAYDTGIRVVRVRWQKQEDQEEWSPEWPPKPSQIGCRRDRLKEFLAEFGLPQNLIVRSGTISISGQQSQRKLHLIAELSSVDFPDWRHNLSLRLNGQTSTSFRKELIEAIQEHDRLLVSHVAQKQTLCGVPAKFGSVTGSERTVDATIDHPEFGALQLRGSLGYDGRFGWEPKLELQDKVRIINALTRKKESLSGLESQLVLAKTHVDPTQGQLSFDLRVKAKDGEPEVQAPISWTLNGTEQKDSFVSVPESVPISVKPKPDSAASATWTRDELGQAVPQILAEDFPNLAGNLKTVASLRPEGVEVRLGIKIADWKELELGPVLVEAVKDLRPVLQKLLSSESVIAASVVQWKEAGEFYHPRYGNVRAELASWSPDEPRARIRSWYHVRNLGEIPWFEDTRLNGEEWTQLREALVADRIEMAVEGSLQALQNLVAQYLPTDSVRLKLDRTGIEGNRWLGLNPLRIALEGTAELPILGEYLPPIKVAGILVDADGIHLPNEYGFSLPITILAQGFAISDPFLMISPTESSLRLGGKITPPVLVAGPGVRNPWLNVMYAEISLGGHWNKPQLEGAGSIALVRTPDVAHGHMMINFQKGALLGEMRVGGRLPGMPSFPVRLGGRLEGSLASKSIQLETRAELFEEEIASLTLHAGALETRPRMDKRFDDPEGFGVRGKVKIPLITSIHLLGEANSKLDQYTIRGRGVTGPFACSVTATEAGIWMNKEFQDGTNVAYWDEWDPNLTTVNMEDPEEVGGIGMEPGLSGRRLSASEQDFVANTFWSVPDNPVDPNPPGIHSPPPEKYHRIDNLDFDWAGKDLQIKQKTEDGKSLLVVQIPATRVPSDPLLWKVFVWRANDGSGHVMFLHKQDLSGRHVAFAGPYQTTTVRNLESLPISVETNEHRELADRLRQRHFLLEVLHADEVQEVTNPVRVPDSDILAFEYRLKAEPEQPILALFGNKRKGSGTISIDVHSDLAGLENTGDSIDPTILKLILEQHSDDDFARLIAVDRERKAAGWYLTENRASSGGTVIVSRSHQGAVQRTNFVFSAPKTHFHQRLTSSRCLARAVFLHPELAKGTAWFGQKGVLIDAGRMLWIVRKRGEHDPQVDRLLRSAFNHWTSETADKLPPDWKDTAQREALSAKQIAETALSDRFETADRAIEPVNRLGLLQTLARESETTER